MNMRELLEFICFQERLRDRRRQEEVSRGVSSLSREDLQRLRQTVLKYNPRGDLNPEVVESMNPEDRLFFDGLMDKAFGSDGWSLR